MKFEIKHRFTMQVLFEAELSAEFDGRSYSVRLGAAVQRAVADRANLDRANLAGAYLARAYLARANLAGAYLARANLAGAYLARANLAGAYLDRANLDGANLDGAYLARANLAGAYLDRANLARANLDGANLDTFKQDLIAEVLKLPHEIDALRAGLVAGKIDGSTYSGECACLAGTMAKARGAEPGDDIACGKVIFHANSSSPRERWFMAIRPGDKPETNAAAKAALGWIDEAIAIRDNIIALAKAA